MSAEANRTRRGTRMRSSFDPILVNRATLQAGKPASQDWVVQAVAGRDPLTALTVSGRDDRRHRPVGYVWRDRLIRPSFCQAFRSFDLNPLYTGDTWTGGFWCMTLRVAHRQRSMRRRHNPWVRSGDVADSMDSAGFLAAHNRRQTGRPVFCWLAPVAMGNTRAIFSQRREWDSFALTRDGCFALRLSD